MWHSVKAVLYVPLVQKFSSLCKLYCYAEVFPSLLNSRFVCFTTIKILHADEALQGNQTVNVMRSIRLVCEVIKTLHIPDHNYYWQWYNIICSHLGAMMDAYVVQFFRFPTFKNIYKTKIEFIIVNKIGSIYKRM